MWIIGNLMQLAKAWWTNYLQPSSWTLNKPLNKLLTRQNRYSKNFAGNIKAKNTLAKLQENKLNGNVITDGVSLCIWRQKIFLRSCILQSCVSHYTKRQLFPLSLNTLSPTANYTQTDVDNTLQFLQAWKTAAVEGRTILFGKNRLL